jgi:hypothetical protein
MFFFQLRQPRLVRCSLNIDSTSTLVHAFVTSRIDYCNGLFASAPGTYTDRIQQVLNAAARLLTETKKYDRGLTQTLRKLGVEEWLVSTVMAMYDGVEETVVRTVEGDSEFSSEGGFAPGIRTKPITIYNSYGCSD